AGAVKPKRVNATIHLIDCRIPNNMILGIDCHPVAESATQCAEIAHSYRAGSHRRWGKKCVESFGFGRAGTHLRVPSYEPGIVDRKRLRESSAQGTEINHACGLAPEKRVAFRSIQCGTGETDYLVEAVNAIRAAEGLLFQGSEIDRRSVAENN